MARYRRRTRGNSKRRRVKRKRRRSKRSKYYTVTRGGIRL